MLLPCCDPSTSTYAGFLICLTVSCTGCEGGMGALLFLSAMVGEDPTEDKFSMLSQGEPDRFWLMFGGVRDEWRLEKVSGDSDGTLERVDSEVAWEGHGWLGVWQSAGSDSRDWGNLPRSENKGLQVSVTITLPEVISTNVQPVTNATNISHVNKNTHLQWHNLALWQFNIYFTFNCFPKSAPDIVAITYNKITCSWNGPLFNVSGTPPNKTSDIHVCFYF